MSEVALKLNRMYGAPPVTECYAAQFDVQTGLVRVRYSSPPLCRSLSSAFLSSP